jgi:hypothetical protein
VGHAVLQQIVHPQGVNVVDIDKTASVEGNHVISASSDRDEIDRHTVLDLLHVYRSTPAIMTSSLTAVRTIFTSDVEITLPVTWTPYSNRPKALAVWMTSTSITQLFPLCQYQLDYYRHRGLRACHNIRRVCVFHDHSIKLSPAAHCVCCVHLTKRCVVMTTTLLRTVSVVFI